MINGRMIRVKNPETNVDSFLRRLNSLADLSIKIGPFALVVPCLIIWRYLSFIKWRVLFSESIGSINGLLAILAMGTTIAAGIVVLTITPSALLALSREWFKPKNLPLNIKLFPFVVYLTSIVSLLVLLVSFPDILWLAYMLGIVVCVLYLWRYKDDFYNHLHSAPKGKIDFFITMIMLGFLTSLAPISSIFPMYLAFVLLDNHLDAIGVVLSLAVIAGLSVFPGALMFSVENRPIQKREIALSGIFLVCFGWFFLFPKITDKIVFGTLSSLGVYVLEEQSFVAQSSEAKNTVFRSGLSTELADTPFRAYLRYGFGNTRLLCREKFDPMDDVHKNITGPCVVLTDKEIRVIKSED